MDLNLNIWSEDVLSEGSYRNLTFLNTGADNSNQDRLNSQTGARSTRQSDTSDNNMNNLGLSIYSFNNVIKGEQ